MKEVLLLKVVLLIAAVILTYVLYSLDKKEDDKAKESIESDKDVKSNKGENNELKSLRQRRVEYVNRAEYLEKIQPGIDRFQEIASELTKDKEVVCQIENLLVKDVKHECKYLFPISEVDDSQENNLLKESLTSKKLSEYWNEKGVNVYHFIHLNSEGERNIYISFELNMNI